VIYLVLCVIQVVVNALIQAIPAIFNVLLVCLVFWLIFSIMGVNLFGGRFSSCIDAEGSTVSVDIVKFKNDCDIMAPLYNYTWFTPKVNFDNCLIAYLALFQVVSVDNSLSRSSLASSCGLESRDVFMNRLSLKSEHETDIFSKSQGHNVTRNCYTQTTKLCAILYRNEMS